MKFIHTADIHLDSPLHRLEEYEGAPVDEIRRASRRAFENLIDLAREESVDFILIAGDLFDGDWKDYNTGLYFVSQMRRLNEDGIPVFIVAGNHDAEGKMTRKLPYPQNVHVFSSRKPATKTLEKLEVAIHGQSFAKPAMMDNIAKRYPEPLPGHFNIGLLHTSLNGRENHAAYAPCSVDDLNSRGYDYWALGHVHQFEIVASDPPVVFPGCIQGRHVKENNVKGCVLVEVQAGTSPEINHHALDVIRWQRLSIELSDEKTLAECMERFSACLDTEIERQDSLPVVVRVEFSGETDLHQQLAEDPQHVKESVRSTAITTYGDRVWIEKIKIRTRPREQITPDPGPLRELKLYVDELSASEEGLLALSAELSDLFKKLPPDYRQGEARLNPDDPQQMRRLVEQAHALLFSSLTREDGGS
jgi:DNA repair exonuclease SbcCD nuclease subunit